MQIWKQLLKKGLLSVEAPSNLQVYIVKTDGSLVGVSPQNHKDFIDNIKKRIREANKI